jgi:hypothetical protein
VAVVQRWLVVNTGLTLSLIKIIQLFFGIKKKYIKYLLFLFLFCNNSRAIIAQAGVLVLGFYHPTKVGEPRDGEPWALNQGRRVNKRSSQLFFRDFLYF